MSSLRSLKRLMASSKMHRIIIQPFAVQRQQKGNLTFSRSKWAQLFTFNENERKNGYMTSMSDDNGAALNVTVYHTWRTIAIAFAFATV